jgi:hypothetical protein
MRGALKRTQADLVLSFRVRTLTGKEIELDIEPDYKVTHRQSISRGVSAPVAPVRLASAPGVQVQRPQSTEAPRRTILWALTEELDICDQIANNHGDPRSLVSRNALKKRKASLLSNSG